LASRALKVNPNVTLKKIYTSRIYTQILMNFADQGYDATLALREGYADCQRLLTLVGGVYGGKISLENLSSYSKKIRIRVF